MAEIQLTIDGREVRAEAGTTILEAARKAGIQIPHLCYREDLTPDHGLPPLRGGSGRGQDARRLLRLPGGQQNGGAHQHPTGAGCPQTGRGASPFRSSLRLHDLRKERHLPPGKIRLSVRHPPVALPGGTARLSSAGFQPFLRAGLQQVHPLRTVRHGLP